MEEIQEKKKLIASAREFYDKNYKRLLIVTFLLLAFAIGQIAWQIYTTGDFMSKGVSLKGGITLSLSKTADSAELSSYLQGRFPDEDISVRELNEAGVQKGVTIETTGDNPEELINALNEKFGTLSEEEYNVEVMGSSLGESFFRETFKAVLIAFLFMGVVIFIYFSKEMWPRVMAFVLGITNGFLIYYSSNTFIAALAAVSVAVLFYIFYKYSVPSLFVILCCFCDIIETLAIVNLLGMKVSTAGVAAFLMLIGYSVDTDILLTTKVLKRKEGTVFESTLTAVKTGMMLTITAIIAVVVALFFAQADVLKEIMTIILIGLLLDIVNTWIQNAGILRWYLERKKHVQA